MPQVRVEPQGEEYVIRPIDRPSDLEAKFQQAALRANPERLKEGPSLFQEVVQKVGGGTVEQLGGIKVSQSHLSATLAALGAFGFDVVHA